MRILKAPPNIVAKYLVVDEIGGTVVEHITLNTTDFPYPAQEAKRRAAHLLDAHHVPYLKVGKQ